MEASRGAYGAEEAGYVGGVGGEEEGFPGESGEVSVDEEMDIDFVCVDVALRRVHGCDFGINSDMLSIRQAPWAGWRRAEEAVQESGMRGDKRAQMKRVSTQLQSVKEHCQGRILR